MASPLTRQDVVDLLVTERYAPLPDLPRPPAARPAAAPVRKPEDPAVAEQRRQRLCEAIDGRYLIPIDPTPRKAA